MRVRSLMIVFLVLFAVQAVAAQQAPGADFDEYVNKAIKDWGVPGVAIAIVKDDKVVMAKGFGVRELNKPTPVDEHTLFAIGSSSKALMYRIVDFYLSAPQRDWSSEMLKVTKGLEDQAKAADKKAEDERVQGTSPSLALDKYAGTFQSEMYGESKVALENNKLVLRFGPNFTGDLQHWNYDTFRIVWRDPMQGKGFVNFRVNRQGKVEVGNIEGLAEFTRVPEPATKALTSVKE